MQWVHRRSNAVLHHNLQGTFRGLETDFPFVVSQVSNVMDECRSLVNVAPIPVLLFPVEVSCTTRI